MNENKGLSVIPNAPLGLETVDNSDLVFPRVILTQALSKFVQEDGLKAGVFVNSLTKKPIKDTTFIPLIASKYWDLLKPEGGRMVFEARVTDEKDPRLEGRQMWTDGDKKANVNTVLAVIALVEGAPMVIPFSKSSYKAGKTLLTLAKIHKGPFFSMKYHLAAIKETKGSNTYFVTEVKAVEEAKESEKVEAYDLYRSLAPKSKQFNSPDTAGENIEEVPF